MDQKEKGNRVYLNVPYDEKDEAKKMGARWDPNCKLWFVSTQLAKGAP
jgi:hypothetical protein